MTFVNLAVGQPESLQANSDHARANRLHQRPAGMFNHSSHGPRTDRRNGVPSNGFIADGLFIGQPKEFNQLLLHLAEEADEATREL